IKWTSYCCYIGAEGFGTDLCCTWQLYDPKFDRMMKDNSLAGTLWGRTCPDRPISAAKSIFYFIDYFRNSKYAD
ncbi:MAG: hypothetical protein ACYCXJ_04550, partial [Thermoleophilia bacterium]